ncbi:MAG: choice-of-anchor J domain-containing protein, partial [Bacteroidales bacterium]|nr:choice-of-anchor J domain-containing protein [Bacteroidales bacterium]
MAKFITRTMSIALVIMLCVGLNAQNANPNLLKNVSRTERELAQQQSITPVYSSSVSFKAPARARGTNQNEVLNESFPNGTLSPDWLNLDVDGDGRTWRFILASTGGTELNSEGRTDAHSINSGSYYNDVGALTPNNWLITPDMPLGGNTVLTYWVKVIDPLYALDTYGVYVSQGSTDPNDFT